MVIDQIRSSKGFRELEAAIQVGSVDDKAPCELLKGNSKARLATVDMNRMRFSISEDTPRKIEFPMCKIAHLLGHLSVSVGRGGSPAPAIESPPCPSGF
jgi:hypothetical protein